MSGRLSLRQEVEGLLIPSRILTQSSKPLIEKDGFVCIQGRPNHIDRLPNAGDGSHGDSSSDEHCEWPVPLSYGGFEPSKQVILITETH
jgi:hypothetical protein